MVKSFARKQIIFKPIQRSRREPSGLDARRSRTETHVNK